MSAVPVQKPIIISRPKPQLRIEQGARPALRARILAGSVRFSVIAVCVFFASSLFGQVMLENARRDGIRAVQRAKQAAKDQALLRDRVLALTRASAIDAWAEANGFVSPESLALAPVAAAH